MCPSCDGVWWVAGRLPWVATICGFVLVGADLTGFREDPSGMGHGTSFVLESPGEWFAAFDGRRLPTTVGGHSWLLWTPDVPARLLH